MVGPWDASQIPRTSRRELPRERTSEVYDRSRPSPLTSRSPPSISQPVLPRPQGTRLIRGGRRRRARTHLVVVGSSARGRRSSSRLAVVERNPPAPALGHVCRCRRRRPGLGRAQVVVTGDGGRGDDGRVVSMLLSTPEFGRGGRHMRRRGEQVGGECSPDR